MITPSRAVIRRGFSAALLALGALLPAAALQSAELAGMALVEALRLGGYAVYFRHAATDWSQADHVEQAGDWTSCDPDRMRQLSEAGRASARRVGVAMRALGIPVDRVFASPYCRTVETAEALGLGPVETTDDVIYLRIADRFGGRDAVVARARARLATPPVPGTNDVYVAHGNVAREATPVYPGEGEAAVFRPDGEGFAYVGRLPPEAWLRAAGPVGTRER